MPDTKLAWYGEPMQRVRLVGGGWIWLYGPYEPERMWTCRAIAGGAVIAMVMIALAVLGLA